ncbi:MAG: hypothetical protein KF724_05120 [Phycisphaeraceae bacterium]|nr:hypothetical protein [Phycisphaeraceae bacterium]
MTRVDPTPQSRHASAPGALNTRPPTRVGSAAIALFFVVMALITVSIAAPGVAAIGAFRTLPKLGLSLPDYTAYAGSESAVMGRIAAGMVMQPVFQMSMQATLLLSFGALVAWILSQIGGAVTPRRGITRMTNVAIVLLCSLSLGALFQADALRSELGAYLEQARAGDKVEAEARREVFDRRHRAAERLNGVQFATALAAVAMAGLSLLPRRGSVP